MTTALREGGTYLFGSNDDAILFLFLHDRDHPKVLFDQRHIGFP